VGERQVAGGFGFVRSGDNAHFPKSGLVSSDQNIASGADTPAGTLLRGGLPSDALPPFVTAFPACCSSNVRRFFCA